MTYRQTTLEEQVDIALQRFKVYRSAETHYSVRDRDHDTEVYLTADQSKAQHIADQLNGGQLVLDEDGYIKRED